MIRIKRNHINIHLTKIPKYVHLKSQGLNGMFIEFKTSLTPFKVTNYSLPICVQPNFTVKERHINCKPHEEKVNMQLNSESHLYAYRSDPITITPFSKSTFMVISKFRKGVTHFSGLNCAI